MLCKEEKGKGLVFTPNGSNGLKYFSDANFSGAWFREDSDQVGSVLSIIEYMIKLEMFLIFWVSKI